jgi:hypothetical protein
MVIGKATRDYGEPRVETYSGSAGRNAEIVNAQQSPFWYFLTGVLTAVLRNLNLPYSGDRRDYLAWSNVAKIGRLNSEHGRLRNPSGSMLSAQADVCIRALTEELDLLSPHAVLITTGKTGFGNDIVGGAICPEEIVVSGETVPMWHLVHPEVNKKDSERIFRLRHPQGLKDSRAIASVIAETIASELRDYKLTE